MPSLPILSTWLPRIRGASCATHPFIDGSKRTGFMVGILFLELNGYCFSASEEGAAQAVLQLASGNLDEAGDVAFLRANASQLQSGGSNAMRNRKC